jgi:hypothetical protein
MPQVVIPIATAVGASGLAAFAGTAIGGALINLGAGLLVNVIASKLAPKVRAEDLARELQIPTALPAYRYVYGDFDAPGTPLSADVRSGDYLYGCWLVNSRPSDLSSYTLRLDKRDVTLTGDPFDFTGSGATATNDPFAGHVTCWIGRGDQTAPPDDILADVPYDATTAPTWFKATDGGRGMTLVWIKLDRGANATRADRWPSSPPAVSLRGTFSKVYDPRDVTHDLSDPTTWDYSNNQALCLLDAATQNPIAPHGLANINMPLFEWAADVADESVDLNGGGTESRYPVGGILTFSRAELEDQLQPLADAGGSQLFREAGKLGIVPATWNASAYTLTDLIGDGYEFRALAPGRDLYTHVRTYYTAVDRDFETAEYGEWPIPGATGAARTFEQQLSFVTSATQAQRLRKIQGLRLQSQKSLVGVAPPEMVDILPGATVTVAISGRSRLDGTYQLINAHPAAAPVGDDGGVALRVPFEMVETSAATFAWDETTEEEAVENGDFDEDFASVADPGTVSTTTGAAVDLDTGGTIIPRVLFEFDPSTTSEVTEYEWEYDDPQNNGVWLPGGKIPGAFRNTVSGKVYGFMIGLSPTTTTKIRVRAVAPGRAAGTVTSSGWVESATVAIGFAVTVNSATGGDGSAVFNVTGPTNVNFAGVKIYRATVGAGFGAASAVTGTIALASGATGDVTAGDDTVANLLTNGDFATTDDWITAGGAWTIAGGTATKTNTATAANLRQSVSINGGDVIRLRANVLTMTTPAAKFIIAGRYEPRQWSIHVIGYRLCQHDGADQSDDHRILGRC